MAGVGAILCLEITNFCWGLRFSVRDATCLPYGEETFDAVEISNALHIMLGAEQTLRKSLHVLKPDGVQVLTTPQGPYGDALMNTAVYHLPAGEERTVLLEEEEWRPFADRGGGDLLLERPDGPWGASRPLFLRGAPGGGAVMVYADSRSKGMRR